MRRTTVISLSTAMSELRNQGKPSLLFPSHLLVSSKSSLVAPSYLLVPSTHCPLAELIHPCCLAQLPDPFLSSRLIMCGVGHLHPVLQQAEPGSVRVDFGKLNTTGVSGKGKHGAMRLVPGETLAHITCRSAVTGEELSFDVPW